MVTIGNIYFPQKANGRKERLACFLMNFLNGYVFTIEKKKKKKKKKKNVPAVLVGDFF